MVDAWAILERMNQAQNRQQMGVAMRRLSAALLLVLALAGSVRAEIIRFRIEPEASEVTFRASSRLMNAEGRFHRLSGDVAVDPQDLASAKVTVSIEAASIDTGIDMRDSHLRSEDFFDVRRFPTIAFDSRRVEGSGRRVNIIGQLTMHGVTREITVPVEVSMTDVALVASGELVINRRDYGIVYQSFWNPIGDDVRVSFTFRARAS